jgi:hypothetical protein
MTDLTESKTPEEVTDVTRARAKEIMKINNPKMMN